MADEGQKVEDPSPKIVIDDAAGVSEAAVTNLDAKTADEEQKVMVSLSPKPAAAADASQEDAKINANAVEKSKSRSPSRERKRRSRSRSRSRTRRRSRSHRDRRRRSDRDRRRSRSKSPRGRDRRSRDRDRDRRRSRSPRDRRDRYRSRSRDNRRRRRRSPSSSRSRSRSRGRRGGHTAAAVAPMAYPAAGVAAAMFPNMLPSGMNPMTSNMPNLHTLQMQNMAAMAGIAVPGQPGMPIPPQVTRTHRRLYVGGIPNPCFDFQLIEFLGSTLIALGLVANSGRLPIYKAEITQERNFAFIEFWDVADCTACLQLDGIIYSGQALKIRRPKDYVMPYGSFDPPPLGPVAIATLLAQKTGMQPPPGLITLPSAGGLVGRPSMSPGSGGVGAPPT